MRPSTPSLANLVALLALLGVAIAPAAAFFAPARTRCARIIATRSTQLPRHRAALKESSSDEDEPVAEAERAQLQDAEATPDNSLFQRFLSPRIDDPGLPLTDILLAQIVAPTFQIYWLALTRGPNPSWLLPISSYFGEAPELAPRGSLLAPALIHGAGLAVCWLAGALAARSFEAEAFRLKDVEGDGSKLGILETIGRYDTVLIRLIQAGAFASGILILSTQLDLLLEFGGRYIQYGESEETDLRLLVGTVEVINDIFWEALVLGSWRIIHANFMSTPLNRSRRF
ncbi:hypothetical protein ACHAXT_012285 [Thalassiosira profunda]